MDFDKHLEEMTQWYCQLVREPGWREYVLDRVKYMARGRPLYLPLLEAVTAAATEEAIK